MSRIEFTEEWLRDYEKRTGKHGHDQTSAAPASAATAPKKSKYGNRRTDYAGRTFDSAHEAEVYKQLELQVRAGELLGVICQQTFLLPGGVKYVADFIALKRDGTYDVIDAKSEGTRKDKVYQIKRKQMRACLGIEIVEI